MTEVGKKDLWKVDNENKCIGKKILKMERKLASIRKISDLSPIEGADKIELATVDGWKVVVAKDVNHKVGNLVVYCEIDSFLPTEPEFEFLRKSSYKKMGDLEGFRLRSIKLRGQISQGLILPLQEAIDVIKRRNGEVYQEMISEGSDVTQLLGIVKYEPPIPAELAGKVKGLFPSFIRKTDEERVQNLSSEYESFKQHKFYVTEKLDGSSATFYYKDGVFGVCSRNLELLETEGNTFWKVARQLDLENKMKDFGVNISLQGELIGESVQGNPYKIKGQTVRFFNLFDIDLQVYHSLHQMVKTFGIMGIEMVPIIDEFFVLPDTIEELLKYAEDKSVLNPKFDREGVVIRTLDRKVSFKVISNQFLLNEK
jgi:RNA ligase (TIGR02306 family)